MLKSITQIILLILLGVGAAIGFSRTETALQTAQSLRPLASKKSDMERFMEAVAHRESNGHATAVNQLGMMGKYQFSRSTLRLLRKDITPNEFLNNPHVQDTVMLQFIKANNAMLDRVISRYEGKIFKGIRITRSGVLAAAHLGGVGSVLMWFQNPAEMGLVDANGTSIREYMVTFADYKIGRSL